MTETNDFSILLARLDDVRIGLPALAVREIIRAVAIEALPGAPAIVEGVINVRGRITPVIDARTRLGFPALELSPEQFMVTLDVGDRVIAIRVDDVEDVVELQRAMLQVPTSISPVLQRLAGVASTAEGAIVLYDVSAFLDQAEREALDRVTAGAGERVVSA